MSPMAEAAEVETCVSQGAKAIEYINMIMLQMEVMYADLACCAARLAAGWLNKDVMQGHVHCSDSPQCEARVHLA